MEWLCSQLGWPFQSPRNIADLVHLEAVFDVLDLYLWLRYILLAIFFFAIETPLVFLTMDDDVKMLVDKSGKTGFGLCSAYSNTSIFLVTVHQKGVLADEKLSYPFPKVHRGACSGQRRKTTRGHPAEIAPL